MRCARAGRTQALRLRPRRPPKVGWRATSPHKTNVHLSPVILGRKTAIAHYLAGKCHGHGPYWRGRRRAGREDLVRVVALSQEGPRAGAPGLPAQHGLAADKPGR